MPLDQTERLIEALNKNSAKLDDLYLLIINNFTTGADERYPESPEEDLNDANVFAETIEARSSVFPPMESPSDPLIEGLDVLHRIRNTFSDESWERFKALMGEM